MGLCTREVDVFLKNRFHINMLFFPLLLLLLVVVVVYYYFLGFTSAPEVIMTVGLAKCEWYYKAYVS